MLKKLFTGFCIAAIFVVAGCGGGSGPKVALPEGGIKLSYKPALTKTSKYRTMINKFVQASEQGYNMNRLIKGDVTFDLTVIEAGEQGSARMTYKFLNVGVGVFVNSQLQTSEEVDEMKDLEFTVEYDSTGNWKDVEGIDLEEEFRKEEISPISFILSFRIPAENVYVGYTWKQNIDTTMTDEDGTIHRKQDVTYKIVDFVELEGARCIVAQTDGKINITQKGHGEHEGDEYETDITMSGEIKGKIHFDIDNGRIVRQESNQMIDVKGTQVNVTKGEKNPISYYNQETLDARLITK